MRRHMVGIGVALSVLLDGCTHLDAVKVDSGRMKAEGAPYNLTFTQYELIVKRKLAGCFDDQNKPDMKIVTTIEPTRKEARDSSREYVIDFAALRSFFKTTDIAVEYHDNGALKSVNATVQDKTADFLKSTFSVAAKFALLGTGTGAKAQACEDTVANAVKAAERSENDIASKTAALTRQTERLAHLVAVAAALGPAKSNAERRELAEEVRALYKAKAEVDEEQKKLAALVKMLTISTKTTWPPDGTTFSGQVVPPLVGNDIKKWGGLSDEGLAKLKDETGVWALFASNSPSARHVVCAGAPCKEADAVTGLKYRLAMPGVFKVCSNVGCSGENSVLFQDTGMFSQLGPIMTLPLRNYPFMTQTIVLTMNEAGQPTRLGYRSEAGAEKAMDTLGTFVDEYGKVRQARKPKSELDLVNEEAALLEAKAKLAKAKAALEPNPSATQATTTAALRADTALLEAELAKLKAQAALDEALKQTNR